MAAMEEAANFAQRVAIFHQRLRARKTFLEGVHAAKSNADNSQINKRAKHNATFGVTDAYAAEETAQCCCAPCTIRGHNPMVFCQYAFVTFFQKDRARRDVPLACAIFAYTFRTVALGSVD
jgi:hypothetical protein